MIQNLPNAKSRWSWIFYDWANSAFATTVMAGFFPIFFRDYYSAGNKSEVTTAWLGVANSIGSLLIAFSAPVLGAIADSGNLLKRFLFFATLMGALATGMLSFIGQGHWTQAAVVYVLANVAFGAAIAFYDALLPQVSTDKNVHQISANGYALGYLGGGVLFSLNVWMYLKPASFGLNSGVQAVQISFLSVAIWWVLFSVPLFMFVKERGTRKKFSQATSTGLKQLAITFKGFRELENVGLFLLAFFLYNDAVGTTIKMATDYGMSLGFPTSSLISALLLVQFIGFPCAVLFGKLTEKYHPKTGIYCAIGVYIFAVGFAMRMRHVSEFYILAALIGVVQGGIQSLSRSYFSQLIPRGKEGQYFGFYNMLGKFTGLLGPILMAATVLMTGNHRISLIPIMILFLTGGIVLSFVQDRKVAG
jgi:UMF1 family MFS transporter